MISAAKQVRREWWLVTACVALIATLAAAQSWFWRTDLLLYDSALVANPLPPDPDVLIVAIDDASLAELGRWPWPRARHAELLERLAAAGAGALAFDVIFSEPAPDDARLAAALRAYGKVVLPVAQVERADGKGLAEAPPVAAIASAAAGFGHIQIELDPDGLARSVYRREGEGSAHLPLLMQALLDVAAGRPQPLPARANDGDGAWRREGWLRFPFLGPPGTVPRVSYADVLAGRIPAARLKDKLILVGATAGGLADALPVPTSALHQPMPGIEVHAQLLAALRAGHALALAGPLASAALAFAITLILMSLLARLPARSGGLLTLGCIAGLLLACYAGARICGIWVAPSAALLAMLLAWPLWSWRRLEATQRYLNAELATLGAEMERPGANEFDPLQEQIAIVRAAAENSRRNRRFLADTLEHLPVGVIVTSGQGQVRLANPLAHAWLQTDSDRGLEQMLNHHLGTGWTETEELPPRELELDGNRRVQIGGAALGNMAGRVLVLTDLSELRAAQSLRDDALRFLSHDLRSPIASIISLADSGADGTLEGDAELFERLGRQARLALERADSVLRLLRASAADPARFEALDLVRVIHEAAEECWALARDRKIRLEVDDQAAAGAEALVSGDLDLLRRAVGNLIGNAIKHGTPETCVVIRLLDSPPDWSIAVSDQGPGIAQEDLPKLFVRPVRLQPGRSTGYGLGLVFVRTVLERHGGRALAASTPGQGSVFTLSLPKAA